MDKAAAAKTTNAKHKVCPLQRAEEKARQRRGAAHSAMMKTGNGKVCPLSTTLGDMDIDKNVPAFGVSLRNKWDRVRAKFVKQDKAHTAARKAHESAKRKVAAQYAAMRTAVNLEASNSHRACKQSKSEYEVLKRDVFSNVKTRKSVATSVLVVKCYVKHITNNNAAHNCSNHARRQSQAIWNIRAPAWKPCHSKAKLASQFGPTNWHASWKNCSGHRKEVAAKEKVSKEKAKKAERAKKEKEKKEKARVKELKAKAEKASKKEKADKAAKKEKAAKKASKARAAHERKHKSTLLQPGYYKIDTTGVHAGASGAQPAGWGLSAWHGHGARRNGASSWVATHSGNHWPMIWKIERSKRTAGTYTIKTTAYGPKGGNQPAGWGLSSWHGHGARRNAVSSRVAVHSGNHWLMDWKIEPSKRTRGAWTIKTWGGPSNGNQPKRLGACRLDEARWP